MPLSRRYAFHRGKLFIEEEGTLLMLHPWPSPWAKVRASHDRGWRPTVPDFSVVTPVRRPKGRAASAQLEFGLEVETKPTASDKRRIALARFRARLPKPVARAVESLRSLQWQHLVACAMADRFVELIESNPVLAYLWLSTHQRHFTPERLATAAALPQRELLRRLRLRDSKATVKFLRKCYRPALNPGMAEGLRAILANDEALGRLHHVKQAGSGLVALAQAPRVLESCAPALLDEVATCKDELYRAPTAMRIENHLEMASQLGHELRRPFRSREILHRAHREMVELYREQARQQPSPGGAGFGLPPLPGTHTIQPLTTPEELGREGTAQDNCVASYARRVRCGTHFIYRVTWPQRCTLSIVKGPDGRWHRGELEVSGNCPAAPGTCEAIDAWIRNSQKMLLPGCS